MDNNIRGLMVLSSISKYYQELSSVPDLDLDTKKNCKDLSLTHSCQDNKSTRYP